MMRLKLSQSQTRSGVTLTLGFTRIFLKPREKRVIWCDWIKKSDEIFLGFCGQPRLFGRWMSPVQTPGRPAQPSPTKPDPGQCQVKYQALKQSHWQKQRSICLFIMSKQSNCDSSAVGRDSVAYYTKDFFLGFLRLVYGGLIRQLGLLFTSALRFLISQLPTTVLQILCFIDRYPGGEICKLAVRARRWFLFGKAGWRSTPAQLRAGYCICWLWLHPCLRYRLAERTSMAIVTVYGIVFRRLELCQNPFHPLPPWIEDHRSGSGFLSRANIFISHSRT